MTTTSTRSMRHALLERDVADVLHGPVYASQKGRGRRGLAGCGGGDERHDGSGPKLGHEKMIRIRGEQSFDARGAVAERSDEDPDPSHGGLDLGRLGVVGKDLFRRDDRV